MELRFQQKSLNKGKNMLSENVLTALNIQMGHELTNYYIYKNFAGIADFLGLDGTKSWFEKQSEEEKGHFEKFYKYISDKGHLPKLSTLPEQETDILSFAELFAKTIETEAQTTNNLRLVAQICKEDNDDQTYELILWFLKEQVEEEDTVRTIYQRILMSSNNPLKVDEELAERA